MQTKGQCVQAAAAGAQELFRSGDSHPNRLRFINPLGYTLKNMTYLPKLRLAVEPIPITSRLAALAKLLPRQQWDKLRRAVYRRARYRCQICGRTGRMYCHEIWHLNEQTGYQWLMGFEALCEDCHGVKHIIYVHDNPRRARLLEHFITVNSLTKEQAEEYLLATSRWQKRINRKPWVINYGQYNWQVPSTATVQQRQSYAGFNHPCYR